MKSQISSSSIHSRSRGSEFLSVALAFLLMFTNAIPAMATFPSKAGIVSITDFDSNNGGGKKTNQMIYFGTYGNSGIKMRVLSNDAKGTTNGKTFLLSDIILKNSSFSNDENNKWANSPIRTDLNDRTNNDSFASTAFTRQEWIAIQNTTHNTTGDDVTPGEDVADHVYLLSGKEVTGGQYGFDNGYYQDPARIAKDASGKEANWWLCSPGGYAYQAFNVQADGTATDIWTYVTNSIGVRPALNLDQESVLFLSAAEGGKGDVNVGDGFNINTDYDGSNGWKLTLKDEYDETTNSDGIKAPTDVSKGSDIEYEQTIENLAERAGESGTINLSSGLSTYNVPVIKYTWNKDGAGAANYISALVYYKDPLTQGLNLVNYARIATVTGESSSSSDEGVMIDTANLLAGEYDSYIIKIFAEYANGAKATDYASALVGEITYQKTIKEGSTTYESELSEDYKNKSFTAELGNGFNLSFEAATYEAGITIADSAPNNKITGDSEVGTTLKGTVTVADGRALNVAGKITLSGGVNSTGTLALTSGNQLTLSGNSADKIGSLQNNGIVVINKEANNTTVTLTSASGDTGTLTITKGAVTVTGDITQSSLAVAETGALTVGAGNLKTDVSNSGTVTLGAGNLASNISGDGGTTKITGAVTNTTNMTITQNSLEISSGSLTTNADQLVISGNSITNSAQNGLVLTGGTLEESISGNGSTKISGGTVEAKGTLGQDITVSAATDTLKVNGATLSDGKTISGAGKLELASDFTAAMSQLTLTGGITNDTKDQKLTLTGSGTFTLNVTGAGTTEFSNTGTDNKVTIANDKTLETAVSITDTGIVENNGTISGAVTNNGTLTNNGTISGAVTVNESGDLTNDSTISGAVTNGGNFTTTAHGITGGVKNNADLTLTGGDLGSAISGTGATTLTGTVTIAGDKVTTITQESLEIQTGASLATNANNLTISDKITNSVTDGLVLTGGTLNSAVAGDGGSVKIEDSAKVTIEADVAQAINVGDRASLWGNAKYLQGVVTNESTNSVHLYGDDSVITCDIKGTSGLTTVESGTTQNLATVENMLNVKEGAKFTNGSDETAGTVANTVTNYGDFTNAPKGIVKSNVTNYGTVYMGGLFEGKIYNTEVPTSVLYFDKGQTTLTGETVLAGQLCFNLANYKDGDIVVTTANTLDVSGITAISLKQDDKKQVVIGKEKIILVDNATGYGYTRSKPYRVAAQMPDQILTVYKYNVFQQDDMLLLNGYESLDINPRANSLLEAHSSVLHAVTGANNAISDTMDSLDELTAQTTNDHKWSPFFTIQGNRRTAGDGYDLDTNYVAVVAGVTKRLDKHGRIAFFANGGNGSYKTFNEFVGSTDGLVSAKGDMNYFGGGIYGKYEGKKTRRGNFYADASISAGYSTQDYYSENFRDSLYECMHYVAGAKYLNGYTTVGYNFNLDAHSHLEAYVKYMHSVLGDDRVYINLEDVDFGSITSSRARFGLRYTKALTNNESGGWVKGYLGAAYEYEFDTKAKANAGFTGEASRGNFKGTDDSGGSAMLELGVKFQPAKNSPWNLDFALQGFGGHTKSIGLKLTTIYQF